MRQYSTEEFAAVWESRELAFVPQTERIRDKPLPAVISDQPARIWIAVDGGAGDDAAILVWYEVGGPEGRAGAEELNAADYAYVMAIYERAYALARSHLGDGPRPSLCCECGHAHGYCELCPCQDLRPVLGRGGCDG